MLPGPTIECQVGVAPAGAEDLAFLAAYPIGLLHRSERERHGGGFVGPVAAIGRVRVHPEMSVLHGPWPGHSVVMRMGWSPGDVVRAWRRVPVCQSDAGACGTRYCCHERVIQIRCRQAPP